MCVLIIRDRNHSCCWIFLSLYIDDKAMRHATMLLISHASTNYTIIYFVWSIEYVMNGLNKGDLLSKDLTIIVSMYFMIALEEKLLHRERQLQPISTALVRMPLANPRLVGRPMRPQVRHVASFFH